MKEKFKTKLDDLKYKIKAQYYKTRDWVINNRELVVQYLPVIIAAIGVLDKRIVKIIKTRRENNLHDRYIYDHSTGFYWYCKRKLRKRDMLEIEKRRKRGEKYGEILQSLGLI